MGVNRDSNSLMRDGISATVSNWPRDARRLHFIRSPNSEMNWLVPSRLRFQCGTTRARCAKELVT